MTDVVKILVVKKVNCAPCATLTRLLPTLTNKYSQFVWEVVEVTDPSELDGEELIRYRDNIRSFPTTLLLDDSGNVVDRQAGALGVDATIAKYASAT